MRLFEFVDGISGVASSSSNTYILQQNSMFHVLACIPSRSHSDHDHRHRRNGEIVRHS